MMEALLCKEALFALGTLGPAYRSAESDEVEVKRQGFPLRNERCHPWMGFDGIHPFRDETNTLSNPEDMCIHREGIPSQTEEKEAMDGLGTHPFKLSDQPLDLIRIHLS